MKKNLNLPRPLVNKILSHAQQTADAPSQAFSCGIIGIDQQDNKVYYPIEALPPQTNTRTCCDKSNPAYQSIKQTMQDKGQTELACVFTASQQLELSSASEDFFPYNHHLYIINSLDTKGVLTMQARYRDNTALNIVDLALD